VTGADRQAIQELVACLHHKDKNIQNDAIRVLYEVGAVATERIAPYTETFVALLGSGHSRMVWGTMIALSGIASLNPQCIYPHLPRVLDAAMPGSVIARDHAVKILVQLAKVAVYHTDALALLIDQLKDAPLNQLPTYAEQTLAVISQPYKNALAGRLPEVAQESKHRRIRKVLKKLAA